MSIQNLEPRHLWQHFDRIRSIPRPSRHEEKIREHLIAWAKERGFTSLIVVTSAYHMPRTMAELERQMPDTALVPFPVVTDKLRNEPWWASAPTARLIFSEYAKFVVAHLRMRIEPPALTDAPGENKKG